MAGGATGAIVGGILGGKAGAIGGGIGGAALGTASAAAMKAVAEFSEKTKEASAQLTAYNRSLAQFSALMAANKAREELREMGRERYRGDRLAASAEFLSKSEQTRKDNAVETEILGSKIEGYVTGAANYIVAGLSAPLNEIAGLLNDATGDNRVKMALGAAIADAAGAAKAEEVAAKDRKLAEEDDAHPIPFRGQMRRGLERVGGWF